MYSLKALVLVCVATIPAGSLLAQSAASPLQDPQVIHSHSTVVRLQDPSAPEPLRPSLPLSLETALLRTLASNPDLIAIRQGLQVSAEAVQVAKLLPDNLNPTLAVDVRPWVFGVTPQGGTERLEYLVNVNFSQPIELGQRTAKRIMIAHAEYQLTYWNIVQAELLAHGSDVSGLRNRRVPSRQAPSSPGLGRLERPARPGVAATDGGQSGAGGRRGVPEVENLAAQQRVEAAQLDYIDALAALRQTDRHCRVGRHGRTRGQARSPARLHAWRRRGPDANGVCARPEIQTARAQVERSRAALALARADRIPIPSLGPVYEKDESGIQLLRDDRQQSRSPSGTTTAGWRPNARPNTIATWSRWSRRSSE